MEVIFKVWLGVGLAHIKACDRRDNLLRTTVTLK